MHHAKDRHRHQRQYFHEAVNVLLQRRDVAATVGVGDIHVCQHRMGEHHHDHHAEYQRVHRQQYGRRQGDEQRQKLQQVKPGFAAAGAVLDIGPAMAQIVARACQQPQRVDSP
jgi:hypothetical protein